jgi:hypothetical protein
MKRIGKAIVRLGVSTSDESFWRYSYGEGISPAVGEDAQVLESVMASRARLGLGSFKRFR